MAGGLQELTECLAGNKTVVFLWAALVVVFLVLIIMAQKKVGFYPEKLVNSGTEVPPDRWNGTDLSPSIVPNQYGGNSTGGISAGAAVRHGAENTSGTASWGDGRSYIYTTRLDEAVRSYNDPEGPAFSVAHGHVQGNL